jgi:Flp pilus assembly protein TadB
VNAFLASGLAAAAILLALGPSARAARRRLGRISASGSAVDSSLPGADSAGPRLLAAVGMGLGIFVLVGGLVGACVAVLAAVLLSRWLAGLEPRSVRRRRERLQADLPTAADLLAACLLSGCPPTEAAEAVGTALDGPLGHELRGVVAVVRLGGDLATSWQRLSADPVLAPLARTWARALETGAPLADAMQRLADEQRLVRRVAAEAEARRAAVRAAAPLGVCFLPAFVLVGVVPAVAGIAADLLG